MKAKSAVTTGSGGRRGSSTIVFATLCSVSISQTDCFSQEGCRNSIAKMMSSGIISRNLLTLSPSLSWVQLGGSWMRRGPNFPLAIRGFISPRKRSRSASAPFSTSSTLSWVMTLGNFAAKTNPLGVYRVQSSRADEEGIGETLHTLPYQVLSELWIPLSLEDLLSLLNALQLLPRHRREAFL